MWQPGSQAVRKWKENEQIKRKWRENEGMERKWRENTIKLQSLEVDFVGSQSH